MLLRLLTGVLFCIQLSATPADWAKRAECLDWFAP